MHFAFVEVLGQIVGVGVALLATGAEPVTELAGFKGAKSRAKSGRRKVLLFLTDGRPTFPIGRGDRDDPGDIEAIEEPIITALVMTGDAYLGPILKLLEERRGTQKGFEYVSASRVLLTYELPLNEIILDFYDRLKSVSRGYASFDYNLSGYSVSDLVKLDMLVGGQHVDALSWIVHRDFAYPHGKALVEKMKELIHRQMFEVAIQAAVGSRVIARESIPAIRKNVVAKCYGGDISRKRKLIEKQKEGKKRMKRVGKIDIPQEAFLAVLKISRS